LNKLQETAFKDIIKLYKKNPIKTNLTDAQVNEIIKESLLNIWNDSWSKNESKVFVKNLVKIIK